MSTIAFIIKIILDLDWEKDYGRHNFEHPLIQDFCSVHEHCGLWSFDARVSPRSAPYGSPHLMPELLGCFSDLAEEECLMLLWQTVVPHLTSSRVVPVGPQMVCGSACFSPS